MIRVAVFSDSHGDVNGLRFAIEQACQSHVPDAFLFLGDGVRDFQQLEGLMRTFSPAAQILCVRGNNDIGCANVPDVSVQTFCGVHVYMTHGHRCHVKTTLSYLAMDARDEKCAIALYGHTHRPKMEDIQGVWVLNPGAVGWACASILTIDFMPDGSFKPELVYL